MDNSEIALMVIIGVIGVGLPIFAGSRFPLPPKKPLPTGVAEVKAPDEVKDKP